MEEKNKYISQFQVQKMWGRINLQWNNINDDVNILVGINGCGKTTLLNLISDYYTGQKPKKNVAESVSGTDISSPVTYIRSFDIPANAKKKTESMLLQELKYIINQNGEGTSFFDYRMKMLNLDSDLRYLQGEMLCAENIGADFEQNILKASLAFEQYDEISRIKADIGKLNALQERYSNTKKLCPRRIY